MIPTLYKNFQRWCENGSICIISDTHFDDADCKLMDENWIKPEQHMEIIKKNIHKNDTLIHLGDVGNPDYLDELKSYKVLITGNHDVLSKVASHFDEVYTGPLFIADRILLSHEPISGMENFAVNIHGHDHNKLPKHTMWEKMTNPKYKIEEPTSYSSANHINLAANVYDFQVFNLGKEIKKGLLANVSNYHRLTIDKASIKKENYWSKQF